MSPSQCKNHFATFFLVLLLFSPIGGSQVSMSLPQVKELFQNCLEEHSLNHTIDISEKYSPIHALVSEPFMKIDSREKWFKASLEIQNKRMHVEIQEGRQFLFFFYHSWTSTPESRDLAAKVEEKINNFSQDKNP